MRKIIEWLMDGGGTFLGYDNDGDRMYSVSNGEALLFAVVVGALASIAAVVLFLTVRCLI